MEKKNDNPGEPPRNSRRQDAIVTTLMIMSGAIAVVGFGVLFSMWWQARISDKYEVLRVASQEFVAGRPIVAGDLAESVKFDEKLKNEVSDDTFSQESDGSADSSATSELESAKAEWIRLRSFLIGAGKVARAAEQEEARRRRGILNEAIGHLEESRNDGFPAGRQADGNRLLGESLFQVGRFDEATDALTAAIERDPALARSLLPTLAKAQLDSLQPTTEQSLETIKRFLASTGLRPDQRENGRVIQILALLQLQRWQDAQNVIDESRVENRQDESEASYAKSEFQHELKLLQSVLAIRRATNRRAGAPRQPKEARAGKSDSISKAMSGLHELLEDSPTRLQSRARLWLARAYLLQDDPEDALTQFDIVSHQRPFGAVGIVAGLEQIEWFAGQGRGLEMLQTMGYVVQEIGDAQGFDASLIGYEDFRRRLRAAVDLLRQQGDFEHAIDATRSLPPIFSRSEALMQEGLVYREWAESSIANGTNARGKTSLGASIVARRHYQAAGDAFAEAAQLEFDTRDYLPTLWSAIDAYQNGRHFSRSIELLKPYLRDEQRRQQPRGLVLLGRALLAVGDPEQAIEKLTHCIVDFQRNPLRPDARLLAGLAHAELGHLDTAKTLLTDNLNDGELAPQSAAYRDSLFALGELLYREGYENHLIAERSTGPEKLDRLRANQPTLAQAVRRLDVAVIRYWDQKQSRAENAAYLSASAHILASQLSRLESKSPEILDAARRTLRLQTESELTTALTGFEDLRDHLISREEEESQLPKKEQAMLRNCFLRVADTLRAMDRLEDAANAYRDVSLRFMNEPSALEAILGQARCLRELGRNRERDMLIRQANAILERIPAEWNGRFQKTTRFDRDGWVQLLAWMTSQIAVAANEVS